MKSIMKKALVIVLALALAFVVPMTAMAAPGESEMEPISLDGTQTTHNVTVDAGATVYYSYQSMSAPFGASYNVTVNNSTRYYDYYLVTPHPMTGMVNLQNMPNMIAQASAEVQPGRMGNIMFAIQNVGATATDFTITTEVVLPQPGSVDMPDTELILDADTTVECIEKNYGNYYYKWTATEAGTFTVTIDESCLDVCDWAVGIQYVEKTDGSTDWVSAIKTKADNNEPTISATVEVGDVVSFYVADYNLGNLTFMATVTTEVIGGGDDGSEGDDVIGGDSGEEEVNYVNSSDYLTVGENACIVDTGYEYTVYTFEPTEDGKYTFTSNNSVMGIVSNNGMWITTAPSAETVNANEFSWECDDVGQSIWVAVKADTNIANITITREDLDKSDEVQWTIYENITTPKAFEYDGDVDELMYVDTFEDDFVNSAVLGKDGYYHLNNAEGPILYVNLNDSLMSLVKIVSTGKLSAVYYGDNGEVTKKVDYTLALLEYLGVKDIAELEAKQIGDNPVIYPLTEDLITMFKEVGNTNKWYGEKGVVGGTAEDAWMFACYYSPTADDGGNDNIGGNTGDNVGDNNGDVSNPKIPNTDYEVLSVAMAMMVATATVGAVIVIRKTKRVK